MLEEIFENVRKSRSFSFETTLSGSSYSRHIPEWRSAGYKVKLFYLRLATPELAIVRVRNRVIMGGHDVPEQLSAGDLSGAGKILRIYTRKL
ncbi:hypothetical protein [Desulfonatronospira thiodismutans]|nr:hypothetical protein [Desulfonatronospira thiodismutans]